MKKYRKYITLIIIFILGVWLGNSLADPKSADSSKVTQNTQWTCSMHPNVKLPDPGQCPICFMDLIPLEDNRGSTDAPVLTLSKNAEQLAADFTTKKNAGQVDSLETYLSQIVEGAPKTFAFACKHYSWLKTID